MNESARGLRRIIKGTVVSDKMNKTVVVKVDRAVKHPVYFKTITKSATYKAHDEGNVCRTGDTVLIEETRPLSKDKRWKVKQVIAKAE